MHLKVNSLEYICYIHTEGILFMCQRGGNLEKLLPRSEAFWIATFGNVNDNFSLFQLAPCIFHKCSYIVALGVVITLRSPYLNRTMYSDCTSILQPFT